MPNAAPVPAPVLDETIEFTVPRGAWDATDAVAVVRRACTHGLERTAIGATAHSHVGHVRLSCRVAMALRLVREWSFMSEGCRTSADVRGEEEIALAVVSALAAIRESMVRNEPAQHAL